MTIALEIIPPTDAVPPGKHLTLDYVTYEDALGRLFEMHLDLSSDADGLDLLGKQVTVKVQIPDLLAANVDGTRQIHGHVNQFVRTCETSGAFCYSATVVPKLWFLTLDSNCRIFQDQSIPQIVHKVLGEHHIDYTPLSSALPYPALEYCVQYGETDFQFVSRLLERAGIYYYFSHQGSVDKLVLTDTASSHLRHSNYHQLLQQTERGVGYGPRLWSWTNHRRLRPVRTEQKNVDFTGRIGAVATLESETAARGIFNYSSGAPATGGVTAFDPVLDQAKLRLKQLQTRQTLVTTVTNAPVLHAGTWFGVTGDSHELPGDYQVVASRFEHRLAGTQARERTTFARLRPSHPESAFAANRAHRANEPLEPAILWPPSPTPTALASGASPQQVPPFECELLLMRKEVEYRPERSTPRPVISGPQTAVVVDNPGDIGPYDMYGRVKVKFHWDRDPSNDRKSSCWVPVSQGWAGKRYGSIHLPHPGQEVIVEFLDGDPDQPIVTGRVYNADNMPPLKLDNDSSNKYQAVVARDQAGNEIILNATDGDEQIRMYTPGNWYDFAVGDGFDVTLGTSFEATVGAQLEITGGVQGSATLGAGFEATIGSSNAFTFGQTFECTIANAASLVYGTSVEIQHGYHLEDCEDEQLSVGALSNTIYSPLLTRLVAGTAPKGATSIEANMAKISMNAGAASLGLDYAGNKPTSALMFANALGCIAGTSAGVAAILATQAIGAVKDDDADWVEVAGATLGTAALAATAIAAGVGSGVVARIYGKQVQASVPVPTPTAWVSVEAQKVDLSVLPTTTFQMDSTGIRMGIPATASVKVNALTVQLG